MKRSSSLGLIAFFAVSVAFSWSAVQPYLANGPSVHGPVDNPDALSVSARSAASVYRTKSATVLRMGRDVATSEPLSPSPVGFAPDEEPQFTELTTAQADRVPLALAHQIETADIVTRTTVPIPVILQVTPDAFATQDFLDPALDTAVDEASARLGLVNGYAVELTLEEIERLLDAEPLRYVTLDAFVRAHYQQPVRPPSIGAPHTIIPPSDADPPSYSGSHFQKTVGTDYAVERFSLSGRGITVALIDSGLTAHSELPLSRILASVDFTKDQSESQIGETDKFGHGTHVAGIIGSTGGNVEGGFRGVAPDVNFVDLRVVGPDGSGRVSSVIQAIEWTIENRDRYGIDVANMSLGRAPLESCQDDPLCQAVEKLTQTGVVAVVSAGNLGKTPEIPELWGGITSPGLAPSAITVGALDTMDSLTHLDDDNADFSSRGPTYPDGMFKPDLSAPGVQVPSLLAQGSAMQRDLEHLIVDDGHIALSGSSMAAGFVSGTVALILEANPKLTPDLVKASLLLSAAKLSKPHPLHQGNGMLNVPIAVLLGMSIDVDSEVLLGEIPPSWILEGEEIVAGGAIAFADRLYLGSLGNGMSGLWGEGKAWMNGRIPGDNWIGELFDPESPIWTGGVIWACTYSWPPELLADDAVDWIQDVEFTPESVLADDAVLALAAAEEGTEVLFFGPP